MNVVDFELTSLFLRQSRTAMNATAIRCLANGRRIHGRHRLGRIAEAKPMPPPHPDKPLVA
jgi:hypothetical protein